VYTTEGRVRGPWDRVLLDQACQPVLACSFSRRFRNTFVYLPIATWLTRFRSQALPPPVLHPWRDPCGRVSSGRMRVEPSPVHLWGGNWTTVRTHTSIQLSKAASAFASHPLGLLQVSRERVAPPSERLVKVSPQAAQALPTPACGRGFTTVNPWLWTWAWQFGWSKTRFSAPSEPPCVRHTI
jgi:hypothetical protein